MSTEEEIKIPVVPLRALVGFAKMDRELHRALAKKGNKALRKQGKIHQYTSETARLAGKKGGATIMATRGPDYYRWIGRKGGKKAAFLRRKKREKRLAARRRKYRMKKEAERLAKEQQEAQQ